MADEVPDTHAGEGTPASVPMAEFRYRRRVHFYELDSAGIVHFSTYFRYMEEAEHAFWRAVGLSIAPAGAEVGYPRVAASFDYRRPLRFEDEFEVHLRVVAMGGSSMEYACAIRRREDVVGDGRLTIVSVRARPGEPMRAVPLPDEVRARFAVASENGHDEGATDRGDRGGSRHR